MKNVLGMELTTDLIFRFLRLTCFFIFDGGMAYKTRYLGNIESANIPSRFG